MQQQGEPGGHYAKWYIGLQRQIFHGLTYNVESKKCQTHRNRTVVYERVGGVWKKGDTD